jgi:biopolymer transport protein ExbD
MRIPSLYRDRKGVELQLTPMIDCVFLLMVYFIWSSSFAIVEKTLPSELSAETSNSGAGNPAGLPPEADFERVVVRVVWSGSAPLWQVNGAPVDSLTDLRQTLTTIARIKRDVPVVIDPVGEVPLGDVIDVFDLVRLIGIEKVQFAAAGLSAAP